MTPPALARVLRARVSSLMQFLTCWILTMLSAAPGADEAFRITVVDAQTSRGVPMVELTTVHNVKYLTDSAGVIAFNEPGLMNRAVYFHVYSHGYEYPTDGFGFTGVRLQTTPGTSAVVRLNRVNIAQRLYRITGAGVYRDSVTLGDEPPVAEPLLSGEVLGQDSVQSVVYRGRVHWFWGDTNRASYPLGNFHVSGATSALPVDGGLHPLVGVNLKYFVDEDGFSKKMFPMPPDVPGPVWIDGLMTVEDDAGEERILCHYMRIRTLGEMYERGIGIYNDDAEQFEKLLELPIDAPLTPHGHPLYSEDEDGASYYYFASPFPLVRVRADLASITDVSTYEAFTCLKAGSAYDAENPALDRDAEGRLIYGWKRNTAPIGPREQEELVASGRMTREEAFIRIRDAGTGEPIQLHSGSVAWNEHRQRWIMIAQQVWGTSMGGEVWYAEADHLLGPWKTAAKVITHRDYWFYNVKHHAFFDHDHSIYFEGTYTKFLNHETPPTPWYDYNQIMYRLDLDDPRLESAQSPN